MICSKCGEEIVDGAKFCGVCGNPSAPVDSPVSEPVPEPVVVASDPTPVATSAPVAAPPKPKANKKLLWILIAAVALVLVAVVVVVIFSNIKKEVNIANYLILEEEGYDSMGHVECRLDHVTLTMHLLGEKDMLKYGDYDIDLDDDDDLEDWEDDMMDEYGRDKFKAALKFCESIDISLSYEKGVKNGSLSNDDVVTVEIEWSKSKAKDLKLEISGGEKEYKLSKLTPIAVINVFDYCTLVTEGFDSMGDAYVAAKETVEVEVGDLLFCFEEDSCEFRVEYSYPGDDYVNYSYWYFEIDGSNYNLSNGDVLQISCNSGMWEDLIDYGAAVETYTTEMTVEDLEPITTVDLLSNLNVSFTGVNGDGDAIVTYIQDTLEVNGITYDFINRSIYKNGDYIGYFDYYLNNSYYLENGETSTLEVWMSSDMYYSHGVELTETVKEFTVYGLGQYITEPSVINENILPLAQLASDYLVEQLNNDWNYMVHRWWYYSYYPEIVNAPTLEKIVLTVDSSYWGDSNTVWFVFKTTLDDENLDAPTDYYFAISNNNVAYNPAGEIMQTNTYLNYTCGYDSYEAFWNEQIAYYYGSVYEIDAP